MVDARALSRRTLLRARVSASGAPGTLAAAEDMVAVEEPLELLLAGDPVALTMRTPGDDHRLALGFLFAEGIIRSAQDVGTVRPCGRTDDQGYGNALDVLPAPGARLDLERVEATRRGTLTTSACGVCGRQSVDDLMGLCVPLSTKDGPRLPLSLISRAPDALRSHQQGFRHTGGTRAAAALALGGEVLAAFEDVGRHNAVDKVVGELLLQGLVGAGTPVPLARRPVLLAVSGRASFEILQKAALARFLAVASISAASSLAVDLAQRAGITLASFVRGETCNIHTHAERLLLAPAGTPPPVGPECS